MPGKETRMAARSIVSAFPTELQMKRGREAGGATMAAPLSGKI
jgi:hypothetical protein